MNLKEILSYVLIIGLVILFRTFIATPIKVNGDSMVPNLQDGNLMILKKYDKKLERFDIVVIDNDGEKIIKRIIGLPKEDIKYETGILYINDEVIEDNYGSGTTNDFIDYCTEDEYFVLGDNRETSLDSRRLGCINKEDIIGTTNFMFFPFKSFGTVK